MASTAALPKICLLTETYHPVIGGGETQARLLAEGLVDAGFSVIILTRRSDQSLAEVQTYGQVTVYRLPPAGKGQLKKWGLLLSSFPKLIQLRREYDLIFVSGFRIVGMSAVVASKLLQKACVLKADSQGEMSGEFFRAGLAKLRLKPSAFPFRIFLGLRNRILRRANAFTAITGDIAQELGEAAINERAVHMIPNSVDTSRFAPASEEEKAALRARLDLPASGKIVIYTGRLVSYKGLPLLLSMWQKLVEKHDQLYLLLVGDGGLDMHNCEAELKVFVAENRLGNSVRFTGSVTNVHDYLRAADVFVLPTEDDAFPASLVEAMSCRLPVVTTPVGAISTIVKAGQNGLLVQPNHFEGLLQALDTLLSDSALADALAEAARESVQRRYADKFVNQMYIDLFNSLLDPPRKVARHE